MVGHEPQLSRREFLNRTSAGFLATLIAPGVWSCAAPEPEEKVCGFCAYRPGDTLGKVDCVTPEDGYYLHTFYDVTPFSPSQRYLAVTRIPYQERDPRLGDLAEVCVIDLQEHTIQTVYATKAWSFQLGANVQWGDASDRFLYTNDVIDGHAVCVQVDRETGSIRAFAGPKYDLAPDESYVIGGKLEYMNATQYGYGIPDGPSGRPNLLAPGDIDREGVWKTDLRSNQTRLLVSFAAMAEKLSDPASYEGGTFYCFHTKVNRTNTRVLQILRCLLPDGKGGRNPSLLSFTTEGTEVVQAMSRAAWTTRGRVTGAANHPNWHPNGDYIVMNAVPKSLGQDEMRFCMFRYDGSDLQMLSERHLGSGHPSVDPETRFLIADCYPHETWAALDNGEVPIRLIDLNAGEERMICSVSVALEASRSSSAGSHLRVDPHPAWSRDYKKVCFNGTVNRIRRVFVADLSEVI